jgi:hypothetical protein
MVENSRVYLYLFEAFFFLGVQMVVVRFHRTVKIQLVAIHQEST